MAFDYDLFVIGAGSGGVRAARMSAHYGARVAVAEEFRVGGTCVIRGCIPKKLLVYASRFRDDFEDSIGFGWAPGEPRFDWAQLVAAKDREIARLESVYRRNLDAAGVTVFEDRAALADRNAIVLARAKKTLTAKTILIAAGGHPYLPPGIAGIEHAITSSEAFDLPRLPKSVLIAGAGYIAVEFAGIFHGLGSQVTIAHHGGEILRGFDRDARVHLHKEMERRGIAIRLNERLTHIAPEGGGKRVRCENGGGFLVDEVMFATGRRANTQGLGLEKAGVALDERGAIKVDAYSHTSVEGIYAIGDVTGRLNLTPVAIREGAAFAETVFNNNPTAVDLADVPTAVFGTPELACVGMTEERARLTLSAVDIYKAHFRPLKATLSGRDTQVLMKLVVDAETQRVVGCHIAGEGAAEIVQAVAVAVRMKATKADFDATLALHPTAAEELVLMRAKSS